MSDGDTVQVEPVEGGEIVKVRLYGVDCPEKKQPHGSIATGFVQRYLYSTVDVKVYSVDRYGRRVADIILPNGESLSQKLLNNGHAWLYEQYCTEPFCEEWKQTERQARQEQVGLWNSDNPIPPWKWRKYQKNN